MNIPDLFELGSLFYTHKSHYYTIRTLRFSPNNNKNYITLGHLQTLEPFLVLEIHFNEELTEVQNIPQAVYDIKIIQNNIIGWIIVSDEYSYHFCPWDLKAS